MVAGCAGPQRPAGVAAVAHGPPIDASALQALYAEPHREDGVVLHGEHAGAHWTRWTKPDGSLQLTAAHGLFADTGTFTLRGNALCSRWEHIDTGQENCVHLVRVGPDRYTSYDNAGVEGSTFQVSPP